MQRSHFKKFFETYFNYPYEKLKFREADCVRQEIATSYECQPDDVECFFLFSNLLHYLVKEQKHYGFYRIKGSDIYIPFYAHASSTLITAHVELQFNYNINNSVFDCCHVPLKKEKTVEFYYLVMDNLQPAIKKIINDSDLFTLNLTLKKTAIYFDFDLTCHTLEVTNRCLNFSEFFSIRHNCKMEPHMTNVTVDFRYDLSYRIDKRSDFLTVISKPNKYDVITDFNKSEMFKQSFQGITDFGVLEYTTIDELAKLVKEYRQVEKMYTI